MVNYMKIRVKKDLSFRKFVVSLHAKACESAHARQSMQASLLSLRSALPLGLSKNRSCAA